MKCDPETKTKATDQLRTRIKTITVHPRPEKGRAKLEIIGDISALALLDQPNQKTLYQW